MSQARLPRWSGNELLASRAGFETGWEEGKERKGMKLTKARKDKGSSKIVFFKMFMGPFGVGSKDLFCEWYFLSG